MSVNVFSEFEFRVNQWNLNWNYWNLKEKYKKFAFYSFKAYLKQFLAHLIWAAMFERFKFGSYRIEDTELANPKKTPKSNLCLIKFLDNSNVKFHLDVRRY